MQGNSALNSVLNKSLLVQTLEAAPVSRPPVWLMRQAGRYMGEYRELKARHGFLKMCLEPELAVEVTMQPLRAFDLDAAIIFSDILIPAKALGFEIDFNPGPVVHNKLRGAADIAALGSAIRPEAVTPVLKAISLLKSELAKLSGPPKALLGFAGAPWTMACYLIDQGVQKHFQGTQIFARTQAAAFQDLLSILSDITADYLLAQLEHGADAVQLFDSWAGNLSLEDYNALALPWVQKIVEKVKRGGGKVILYVNGSSHLLPAMCASGADCLSLDWRTDLEVAGRLFKGCIQGNLDPCKLFGSTEDVLSSTREMFEKARSLKGRYIVNLGHGILQQTPEENVAALVQAVKNIEESQ